jgi:hypothetical protein
VDAVAKNVGGSRLPSSRASIEDNQQGMEVHFFAVAAHHDSRNFPAKSGKAFKINALPNGQFTRLAALAFQKQEVAIYLNGRIDICEGNAPRQSIVKRAEFHAVLLVKATASIAGISK